MKELKSKTSEQKDHAVFGASSSERWLNCPGSVKLIEKAPPEAPNQYAEEGTKAHSLFEFLLNNRENIPVALKVAKKQYPKEMIEHVMTAVDYVLGELLIGSEAVGLYVETKVDAGFFTRPGEFGTLDVAIVDWDTLHVIDFKYGGGTIVEPQGADGKGNPQLVYYALGFMGNKLKFKQVKLTVIQPRGYHDSGETIRSFELPEDELRLWASKFKIGVLKALKDDAPLNLGDWCKYCRAAIICPEKKDNSFKRAQVVFSDEKGLQTVPEPKLLSVPNLSKALDAADHLEDWIKKLREHAFHVLSTGGEIGGYKLVEKRGTRKWQDAEKTAAEAKKLIGSKAFSEPELLSPAQLEKVIGKEFVNERTEIISSGLTMVTDTDKRAPVNKIEKVFTVMP